MTTASSSTARDKTRLPKLRFFPAVDQWRRAFQAPTSETQINARKKLGLPIDAPILASGHQPIVFHPGIISKLIALDHLAQESGSHGVWIIPDQDIVDPAHLRTPTGSGKDLSVNEIRLGGPPIRQTPAALSSPLQIDPDLPAELESLGAWISGYEHESTLARQFGSAVIGMLCEQLGINEPTIIYASDLMTSVGDPLLDSILEDPSAAIQAYNQAVERFPNAGVRPLQIDDHRIELPFWRLNADSRSEVFVDPANITNFDRSRLVPRGLAMTAIMRSLLSDLFIHGTGGYDYDQITTQWMKSWRNQSLAPVVGITADMYLDLDLPEMPSVDRIVWRAHHARHDPAMLNDASGAAEKSKLVESIREAKQRGDQSLAARLFQELQELLARMRKQHAQQLESFDREVDDAEASQHILDIAHDRTWAFPFYSDQQLQQLKASIIDALESSG